MHILEGKPVVLKIEERINSKLNNLKKKPNIAVLGIKGNNASDSYISRIEKNCLKYGIGFNLLQADNSEEFIKNFNLIKDDDNITGIMFQEPLPKECQMLINDMPVKKDIEGLSIINSGKLMLGYNDCIIPCTSKAVMEIFEYYNIDLTGKKAVIIGRSNIVGKPLIFQLLEKNATVTICHSKTINLENELKSADIIITAIGKAKYITDNMIKNDTILIDVGINFIDGHMVGDVDFESVSSKAKMCTPVPGGVGPITNILLIENIINGLDN